MRGFTVHIHDAGPLETRRNVRVEDGVDGPPRGAFAGSERTPLSEPVNSENVHRRGQLVDQYRIVEPIAVGGTARVYEAVHQFTQKPVALKIMRSRLATRRDVLERFRQEAIALASLRHENIVAVENAGLTDDARVFIAMELLRGKTLRDLLGKRGKLSPKETIRLMIEVASGVSAAHDSGVIHRDLKPENIFCVLRGPVKVLDLGTAKFGGASAPSIETAVGRVVGTVAYMAPERFQGEPGDVCSDVYALGLIAYECLAGFHPMAPNGKWPSAVDMASLQVTFEPAPIPGISPELWRCISRALEKAPKLRFQSAKAFGLALRDADRSTTSVRVERRKGRLGQLLVPIIAGTLCGLIGSGVAQWFRSSHGPNERVLVHVERNPLHPTASPTSENSEPTAMPVHVELSPAPQPNSRGATERVTRRVDIATTPSASRAASVTQGERRVPREKPNTEVLQPQTRTVTQSNLLGAYESAPGSHAQRDDLPASGL